MNLVTCKNYKIQKEVQLKIHEDFVTIVKKYAGLFKLYVIVVSKH